MSVPEVCNVCGRDWPADEEGWQAEYLRGVVQWYVCPTCQTPEQTAEAAINTATLDYVDNPVTGRRQAISKTWRPES